MKLNTSKTLTILVAFWTVLAFSTQVSLASNGGSVKKGDTVTVNYVGMFKDGTVFDSSEKHDSPLEFKVGSGQVIPGFENAVIGMKVGEEKEFTLQPKDAYGERNPELVQKVDRQKLPPDPEPKIGMGLVVASPNGQHRRAVITAVNDQTVTIDLNHPLAGKILKFKIKITKIS